MTQGFHIDNVLLNEKKKNFIPVFVSSMGGNFNPVKNLNQATFNIPITIYYPVRFKDDFFALNEFLANCFVGNYLSWGTNSGKAVSNISVAQYGEIQNLDFKEFKSWVESNYKRPIDVMEMWMSMSFSLYLSTAGSDFVFGNDAVASLSIPDTEYEDTDLIFAQGSIQSNSEPASQQILGENESEGLPTATSYASGFSVYIKDNAFYKYIIEQWFLGNIQTMTFDFTLTFMEKTFTRTMYCQSVNLIIQKGQLSTITFAFGKKASI